MSHTLFPGNLMRLRIFIFFRIVSPRRHMSCATSIVDESFPNRASMASLDSGNYGTFPEYSAYDDRSFINSPNSSRRTSAVIKPRRSREGN